jgi:ABC-type Zn uptake system ZnuABC Zn-binding protein ZnuA
LKYLKKIIQLAKSKKIKIILYESPVLAESLKHLKNREETILQIQKLAKETETDFVLFKNAQLSSSREYYISTLNLNQKGLKIFNDSLANYLAAELKKLN